MSVVAESAKVEVLPKQYRGDPILVGELKSRERKRYGLSNEDTIVDVVGDGLVDEAVEYCRKSGVIGFDTETGGKEKEDGLNPWKGEIVIVQMGDLDRQYLVWWQTISDESKQKILDLYAEKRVAKVGLNLKFDASWFLVKHGMKARGWNLVDVMLIEQVLNCGLFSEGEDSVGAALHLSGMQQQAKRWLGLDLPKDEELRTGWAQMTPGQWWEPVLDEQGKQVYESGKPKTRSLLQKRFYAADDVIIPLLIAKKQKPWIKRLGLVETVNLENAFLPVLAEMEVRGMRVNLEKWDALAREAEEKLKAAKRQLDKIFDVTVTISVDEAGDVTRTRDKNYASGPELKNLVREYMAREHGVDVVLTNKHLRDSLEKKGINPDRIQKLFDDAAKEAEKLYKESRKKKEKTEFGSPSSSDVIAILWPRVKRYLGRAFYMLDTESKSFKLYKILGDTPEYEVDDTLPTAIGFPAELVDPITDFRKYSKSLGTYGYNWHALVNPITDRLHFDFVQGGLTTGRLSSRPNCYDDRTEILTRSGWVYFSDLTADMQVAQVDPDTSEITFTVPSKIHQYDFDGEMLHFSSDKIDLMVTPDHRMLIEHRKTGRREFVPASDWAVTGRRHLNAGWYKGGGSLNLTPDEVRLLVAIQADGSFSKGAVRFEFRVQHKIDRLRGILRRLGVPYNERLYTRPGNGKVSTLFNIRTADVPSYVTLLTDKKEYGPWLLDLSEENLDVFVEEFSHWDGNLARRTYSSSIRKCVDWVQAVCSLRGTRASFWVNHVHKGVTGYSLNTQKEYYCSTTNVNSTPVPYQGKVYCVTVPTGAVLVRRQSEGGGWKVSISGNCQNIPADDRYRASFEAESRKLFVTSDFDQVEPRIIAHLSDCFAYKRVFFSKYPDRPEFKVYCKGVTEALDLYTEIGKIVGVIPEWMTVLDTKGDEEKGIEPSKEGKKGRKQSKIIVLGLGYGTGKKKFHITLIIDTGEHHSREYSDGLFDRYWKSVPEVKKKLDEFSDLASPEKSKRRIWHPYLECEVTWSETIGGRKRFFRPTSFTSWTEGRNHPIQGTGADILKKAAVLLTRWFWENDIDGGLVNLVHDEFVSEVPAEVADLVKEKQQEIMQMVGESYCPGVPIPVSGSVSDVWKK